MPDSNGLEALFVCLYFDRHIMTRLAVDLRGRGYDVLTTEEAGKDTASDEEQLAFATGEKRSILTFNIRDFAPLHETWQATGRPPRRYHRVAATRQPSVRTPAGAAPPIAQPGHGGGNARQLCPPGTIQIAVLPPSAMRPNDQLREVEVRHAPGDLWRVAAGPTRHRFHDAVGARNSSALTTPPAKRGSCTHPTGTRKRSTPAT